MSTENKQQPAGVNEAQGQAGLPASGGSTLPACPLCGSQLKWKLSGMGKHFGGICAEHGIVSMIRHPLCPIRRKGVFERMGDYMMGR